MINSILPKFLFEEEQIISLMDKGIKIQEGTQVIGNYKIPCYKFFNMNENQVCDELDKVSLHEADGPNQSQLNGYATRVSSTLFLRIRQASLIKDKDTKVAAACALLSAVNSLALVNLSYANRFVTLVRSIV